MSTHDICFLGEIRKIKYYVDKTSYLEVWQMYCCLYVPKCCTDQISLVWNVWWLRDLLQTYRVLCSNATGGTVQILSVLHFIEQSFIITLSSWHNWNTVVRQNQQSGQGLHCWCFIFINFGYYLCFCICPAFSPMSRNSYIPAPQTPPTLI